MKKYSAYIASVIAALFVLSSAATSHASNTPTKTFPPEASGSYQLDASHANILFSASHLGLSEYFGRFNKIEGTLKFDAVDVTKSSITMKVYAASVDSNNSEMEAKFQGADFLNAEKFPMATFTSKSIEKLTDSTGRITGDLTLLGTTKPLMLDVIFNGYMLNPYSKKPTLGFSAKGKFKRSDFGMIAYLPDVGDEVSLIIETEFAKSE